MSARLTILVSGMVAGDPHQGGATWAVLQYVLGLRRLGHDVYLVEPVQRKSLRPAGTAPRDSANAAYFDHVVERFDLRGRAALVFADCEEPYGLSRDQLRALAGRTDILINVSGMLTDESLLAAIPVRVYLDLDPVFVQFWHATQGIDMRLASHTHHVTVGLAIGEPACPVPNCGVSWIKTLPPVVLDHWPVAAHVEHDALTTVANWRGYGSIEHDDAFYGQKAHSLRPLMSLPTLTTEKFSLALAIHADETKDIAALSSNGWHLLDPAIVANTPDRYQSFVQSSKGEFGLAKSGYVTARSGWFSDRSVCYLASARPVIAQDTGFSQYLPTGEGLFAFDTEADVLGAIDAMNSDYGSHARHARVLAEEYFDSDRVLSKLLDRIGAE